GLNLRVAIEASDDSAPTSVVIKLPSLDDMSRATGVALRNYEREVKFYEQLADTVDIRVPHCFHSDWDEATGDFVLVLEDMAPAEQGDQIAGTNVPRAEDAIRELAKLHGPRWDDDSLGGYEWLGRRAGDSDGHDLQGLYLMVFPGFEATYRKHLSTEAFELAENFGQIVGDWLDGRGAPYAVTHGDYRLDNLLFATPAGGPTVTAVDWQTPGHGSPVADLSYFCGAGLLPEDRRVAERSLVAVYGTAVAEYGIDLDATWLWEQFRREAFAGVVMAVAASQLVGGSDRSEALFTTMASRHLQHALDLDSLAAI
ncbi:MAG: phosphotransferase, partial [Acidimicrobiia bacterium]|nr:phosphotransferase [Acidimicrobiia bacterium]